MQIGTEGALRDFVERVGNADNPETSLYVDLMPDDLEFDEWTAIGWINGLEETRVK
ncbi:MAG: hypothetical protein LBS00_10390 [Synergistaceae bacterium]|nr:hypothetical protein [Synergistaceae bacterium]